MLEAKNLRWCIDQGLTPLIFNSIAFINDNYVPHSHEKRRFQYKVLHVEVYVLVYDCYSSKQATTCTCRKKHFWVLPSCEIRCLHCRKSLDMSRWLFLQVPPKAHWELTCTKRPPWLWYDKNIDLVQSSLPYILTGSHTPISTHMSRHYNRYTCTYTCNSLQHVLLV